MSDLADRQLLFAVLAFQLERLDLAQLSAACRGWAADKSRPIAHLIHERGWITAEDRQFIEREVERKLRRGGADVYATLGKLAGPEVREAVRLADDSDLRGTLQKMPPAAGHVVVETLVKPSEQVSRYSLTMLHGQGGLGRVWRARDTDLGREVALKEIRPDRLADAGTAADTTKRFLKEAQVTGQLEHPNIVPVYELARRPQDDQPFYTMRFVSGHTLTEVIREFHAPTKPKEGTKHNVTLSDLLRSFATICHALHYAHSRGVIHRDLKPDNVILGDYGEVQVLDWGLAKLIDRPDEEVAPISISPQHDPGQTVAGSQLGTVLYMAPEQAGGRIDLIEARTDVYGLGAILFEILTGQPPHASEPGTTIDQLLHRIAHDNPPPARTRRSTVPRALDAICAKAMAKMHADRYPTADALRQEVQHWLDDEPVSAAPDKSVQRVARFARKNRGVVGTSMAALLLIAIGTALGYLREAGLRNNLAKTNQSLTTALANEKTARTAETKAKQQALIEQARARTNEQRALAAEKTAEANAATARKQTKLALDTLDSVIFDIQRGLENVAGTLPVRRRLLQTVSVRLEQIATEFSPIGFQDRLAAIAISETADILLRLSETDQESGSTALDAATRLYQKANEINKRLAESAPQNVYAQRDLALSYAKLGDVTLQVGNLTVANSFYELTQTISQRLAEAAPKDVQAQRDLSVSYDKLGDVAIRGGYMSTARKLYEQSHKIQQAIVDEFPENSEIQHDLSVSLDKLGNVAMQLGDLPTAREFYDQGLKIAQDLAMETPEGTQRQLDLSASYDNLGNVTLKAGDPTAALEFYQKSWKIRQRQAEAAPEDALVQHSLLASYNNIGNVAIQLDDLTAALGFYEQSWKVAHDLAKAAPKDAQVQRNLMEVHYKLGQLIRTRIFDFERATTMYRGGLVILEAFTTRTGLKPFEVQVSELKQLIDLCEILQQGVLDQEQLETQSVEMVPSLLHQRGQALTAYAVMRASELPVKVREKWSSGTWRQDLLKEAEKSGVALQRRAEGNQASLYLAASVYGLELSSLAKIADSPELAAEFGEEAIIAALRKQWTAAALECLTAAVAAGYKNAGQMAQDADLAPIRELPEFQALLKQVREAAPKKP